MIHLNEKALEGNIQDIGLVQEFLELTCIVHKRKVEKLSFIISYFWEKRQITDKPNNKTKIENYISIKGKHM